ncbi:hypothetical protein [Psychrobacter sp. I-STPA6b]|uniref:hypothetical protein n=1 Tax=Psychrobacter sp. I-STPA6b TaxID=2585718 RepID=UPI001D0C68CA|nr:hypothetical protein [Psychrobacter sp. I-STPA6b]
MTFIPQQLRRHGNCYYPTTKCGFGQGMWQYTPSISEIQDCLSFSWKMTYGTDGEHRHYRSGGSQQRKPHQIFLDAFIGKMGEIAFYQMCQSRQKAHNISNVDFDCYQRGQWDNSDFVITDENNQTYKVAIKTAKSFSNLLLLETKDWQVYNNDAYYLLDQQSLDSQQENNNHKYDYLSFCRVDSNIHQDFKKLIKQNSVEVLEDIVLNQLYKTVQVQTEVVGYITNSDLVKVIQEHYILPKGSMLGRSTPMDAENYYVQSGCLRKT